MKIGELAKRSGLAASRIRFYEASGLIRAQRLGNGYRDYPEETLHVLEIIGCGQQAGFSLEEMRSLMPGAICASATTIACWLACTPRSPRSRSSSSAWRKAASACCRPSPASKASPRAWTARKMPSA